MEALDDDRVYLANLETAIKQYEAALAEDGPSMIAGQHLAQCLRASSANRLRSTQNDDDFKYLSRLEQAASRFQEVMHEVCINTEAEKSLSNGSVKICKDDKIEATTPLLYLCGALLRRRMALQVAKAFRILLNQHPWKFRLELASSAMNRLLRRWQRVGYYQAFLCWHMQTLRSSKEAQARLARVLMSCTHRAAHRARLQCAFSHWNEKSLILSSTTEKNSSPPGLLADHDVSKTFVHVRSIAPFVFFFLLLGFLFYCLSLPCM